jgi:hypothetical protein
LQFKSIGPCDVAEVPRLQTAPQAIHGGHAAASLADLREAEQVAVREEGEDDGLGFYGQN